ncbi:MAG: hypothetical protein ACLFNU_10935 [Bacteroidales bacterium]
MKDEVIYILKVKGLNKSTDYLQIRDRNLSLLSNIRYCPPHNSIKRFFNDSDKFAKVLDISESLPYGKLQKIEL